MGLFNFKKNNSSTNKKASKPTISLPNDYVSQADELSKKTYALAYICHPKLGHLDFSCFLPLDKSIERNAHYIYEEIIQNASLFPFAENDFGDFYCFDLVKNYIILWSHETKNTVYICDTFIQFLNIIKTSITYY